MIEAIDANRPVPDYKAVQEIYPRLDKLVILQFHKTWIKHIEVNARSYDAGWDRPPRHYLRDEIEAYVTRWNIKPRGKYKHVQDKDIPEAIAAQQVIETKRWRLIGKV